MLHAQTKRFTRTVKNSGAVDDDLIAWAFTEGQNAIADLVYASDVEWLLKNATIDDTASTFGTQTGYSEYRYFVEEDLGITDLVRVKRIWRVDPNNVNESQPLQHIDSILSLSQVRDVGALLALTAHEGWNMDGDLNTSGVHEIAIKIYNKGNALLNGHLRINYWASPPNVTSDDFYQVDTNGDLTNRPVLPRLVWPAIMNYGHLIILETVEDEYKNHALWRRMNGPSGVIERARNTLARFQTGEPEYGHDTFGDIG